MQLAVCSLLGHIGSRQPPPVLVLKDRRVGQAASRDQGRHFYPAIWKSFHLVENDLPRCAALRHAEQPAAGLEWEWVRQMYRSLRPDVHSSAGRCTRRINRHDKTTIVPIAEMFAQDHRPSVGYGAKGIGTQFGT